MKRKNKILIFLVIAALALTCFAVMPSAAESETYSSSESLSTPEYDNSATGTGATDASGDTVEENAQSAEYSKDTPAEEKKGISENVFSQIYEYLSHYAGDIFGALSFAVSLILSFLYKRELLPSISKSGERTEREVKKLEELTTRRLEDLAHENGELTKSLLELRRAFDERAEEAAEALGKIKSVDELNAQKETAKLILSSQVELLYDVFMSSSLPQYQKEKIGNEVARMKEKLANDE